MEEILINTPEGLERKQRETARKERELDDHIRREDERRQHAEPPPEPAAPAAEEQRAAPEEPASTPSTPRGRMASGDLDSRPAVRTDVRAPDNRTQPATRRGAAEFRPDESAERAPAPKAPKISPNEVHSPDPKRARTAPDGDGREADPAPAPAPAPAPTPMWERPRTLPAPALPGQRMARLGFMGEKISDEVADVPNDDDIKLKILSAIIRGVDIVEVFSPRRVAKVCSKYSLQPGESFDLITGWDLSDPSQQRRARALIRSQAPGLVICSPPCTKFSTLQNLNKAAHGPEWEAKFAIELEKAKEHVRFCVSIMREQMAGGRHFLFEHPNSASSWSMPELQDLAATPGVFWQRADMCMYGLTTPDLVGADLR